MMMKTMKPHVGDIAIVNDGALEPITRKIVAVGRHVEHDMYSDWGWEITLDTEWQGHRDWYSTQFPIVTSRPRDVDAGNVLCRELRQDGQRCGEKAAFVCECGAVACAQHSVGFHKVCREERGE